MDFKTIIPEKSISLFVKNILIFEEQDTKQKTILPFFADGYPGLIFQETVNGLLVNPHNKLMPAMFLYGQTIQPIEMVIRGSYRLIVFQLYPFVLKRQRNVIRLQKQKLHPVTLQKFAQNLLVKIKKTNTAILH